MVEILGLGLKLLMSCTLLWTLYEVGELDILIKYPRLTNFLHEVKQAISLYVILRVFSAIVEYILDLKTGWFSILTSGMFFMLLSIRIRFRRQKLADEWNNIPEKLNGELFKQIAIDLKDTTQGLTTLK